MFVVAFGLGWYIMKKIFEREGESIEKPGLSFYMDSFSYLWELV
jgi:hypothetical protein